VSDAYVRWWLAEHVRILAVIGLHPNTFKPHTGTKTSVLLVQKWNTDPEVGPLCPPVNDYPIFFAVNECPVKDNSGEYVYLKDANGNVLLDLYQHQIIEHDLYSAQEVVEKQLNNLLLRDKDDARKYGEHHNRYSDLLELLPNRTTIAEAFIKFAQAENLSFWQEA
jgi:type I restriction enzyme M protein